LIGSAKSAVQVANENAGPLGSATAVPNVVNATVSRWTRIPAWARSFCSEPATFWVSSSLGTT
jgi:hypothetical protein